MNETLVGLVDIIINLHDRLRLASAEIERLNAAAAQTGPRLVKTEPGQEAT